MSQDNAPQAIRPSKLKNFGKNLILIFISLFVALEYL